MSMAGWLPIAGAVGLAALLAAMSCDNAETHGAVATASTAGSGGGGDGGGGGAPPVIEADCQDGWCRIPAGTFVIGSPETECGHPPSSETQAHVTLTRSFLIGQYEVTQAEWTSHGLVNPSQSYPGNPGDEGNCIAPNCPVGNVSWFEAAAFSNLVSQAEGLPACYHFEGCTGELGEGMTCTELALDTPTVYECQGYRLPTEAEWEYAARAGTRTAFYSGAMVPCPDLAACYADPNLAAIGWYCMNSDAHSQPVAQLVPNGWGLHDMIGNHYEWAHGLFTPSGYGEGPLVDPGGEAGSVEPMTARPRRGGAYFAPNSRCRVGGRGSASVGSRFPAWGFRLARTLGDE